MNARIRINRSAVITSPLATFPPSQSVAILNSLAESHRNSRQLTQQAAIPTNNVPEYNTALRNTGVIQDTINLTSTQPETFGSLFIMRTTSGDIVPYKVKNISEERRTQFLFTGATGETVTQSDISAFMSKYLGQTTPIIKFDNIPVPLNEIQRSSYGDLTNESFFRTSRTYSGGVCDSTYILIPPSYSDTFAKDIRYASVRPIDTIPALTLFNGFTSADIYEQADIIIEIEYVLPTSINADNGLHVLSGIWPTDGTSYFAAATYNTGTPAETVPGIAVMGSPAANTGSVAAIRIDNMGATITKRSLAISKSGVWKVLNGNSVIPSGLPSIYNAVALYVDNVG